MGRVCGGFILTATSQHDDSCRAVHTIWARFEAGNKRLPHVPQGRRLSLVVRNKPNAWRLRRRGVDLLFVLCEEMKQGEGMDRPTNRICCALALQISILWVSVSARVQSG